MAGTKNSGNKYSIPINPDAELGEAINHIIDVSGYGSATFLMKDFMEKYREQLIDFWNQQGKDGQAVFDKWFKKWSMTKAEQEEAKAKKEKEKSEKLKASYLALNIPEDKAVELASQFPDKDPLDVVKILGYAFQNKLDVEPEPQPESKDPKQLEIEGLDKAIRETHEKIAWYENSMEGLKTDNEEDARIIEGKQKTVESLRRKLEELEGKKVELNAT
jgi:hypothetical protein